MAFSTTILNRALDLARRGCGHTRPNPPVGAVILDRDGKILAEGYHHRCGQAHAEVDALRKLERMGDAAKAASTLLVTLEPCSRAGRVGACTDAIIAAGIPHVVYLCRDPNPVNRGRAKRALAKAGITCEHLKCPEAEALIEPFGKHVTTGLPFVTVKLAMSLDGRICDDWGEARWVSSAISRRLTGSLREEVDAIMVGGETVRRDNPSLLPHGRRNDDLIRVVISKSGRLPKTARIFTDGAPNRTLVYSDPATALKALGEQGVMHVLCEGGLKLARSLAEGGFVDEWLTVLAPKVIGSRHIGDAVTFKGRDAFICSRA